MLKRRALQLVCLAFESQRSLFWLMALGGFLRPSASVSMSARWRYEYHLRVVVRVVPATARGALGAVPGMRRPV